MTMSNTLAIINKYIVRPNTMHTHLYGKWLVVGVNEELGVEMIDSWVKTKKEAMAIARDHNEYLASKQDLGNSPAD